MPIGLRPSALHPLLAPTPNLAPQRYAKSQRWRHVDGAHCLFVLTRGVGEDGFFRESCIIARYRVRVKEKDVNAMLQACVQNVPKKSNNVTDNLNNDALEAQISVSHLKMLGHFFLPTLQEELESACR